MVSIPVRTVRESFVLHADVDRLFPVERQVRIDMPTHVHRGPSEVTCSACRNQMIPYQSWPGGESVTQAIVRAAPDGRVGDEWRYFLCLRSVVVTWMPHTRTQGTA